MNILHIAFLFYFSFVLCDDLQEEQQIKMPIKELVILTSFQQEELKDLFEVSLPWVCRNIGQKLKNLKVLIFNPKQLSNENDEISTQLEMCKLKVIGEPRGRNIKKQVDYLKCVASKDVGSCWNMIESAEKQMAAISCHKNGLGESLHAQASTFYNRSYQLTPAVALGDDQPVPLVNAMDLLEIICKSFLSPPRGCYDPEPYPSTTTSMSPTSEASTSEASTSEASTSEASTSEASTSEASTSEASTSEASTSETSTSDASTNESPTSETPTSESLTTEERDWETTSEKYWSTHDWSYEY